MKKKILITGNQGYLGKNLTAYFNNKYDVFGLDVVDIKQKNYYAVNITDKEELEKIIKKIKPQIIIHTAALSNLKLCQENPDLADQVNTQSVEYLADIIRKNKSNCKLVFISSDYVFRGDKGNYQETDIPHPSTVYGKTKLAAEQVIQKKLANYAICRTAAIYGRGGNNSFNFLIKSMDTYQTIGVFDDTFSTPTSIDNLMEMIETIIKKDLTGVFHTAGSSTESRYTFAKKVAKYFKKDGDLIKSSRSPKDQLIAFNNSLNTKKTQKILGVKSLTADEGLAALAGEL